MFEDWYKNDILQCMYMPNMYSDEFIREKLDYLSKKANMLSLGCTMVSDGGPEFLHKAVYEKDGAPDECYMYWREKWPGVDWRKVRDGIRKKAKDYDGFWYEIPKDLLTRDEVVFLIVNPFVWSDIDEESFVKSGTFYHLLIRLKKFDSKILSLYYMITAGEFNSEYAETLIQGIDLTKPFVPIGEKYPTTFFIAAKDSKNAEALQFLRTHGVDIDTGKFNREVAFREMGILMGLEEYMENVREALLFWCTKEEADKWMKIYDGDFQWYIDKDFAPATMALAMVHDY